MIYLKKILSVIMAVIMSIVFVSCSFADEAKADITITMQIDNPLITVNGTEQPIDENDTVPTVVNGRTLVPVRTVIVNMGGSVLWDADTHTATLTYGEDTALLTIDSTEAYLNNEVHTLDTAPVVIDGRTLLPICFIAESFDFAVDWNNETRTVTITKADTHDSDTENKEENNVTRLLYQGHGSFRMMLGTGEVIYIDPYAGEGYDKEADLILVTHQHPDHNKIDLMPHSDNCIIFQNSDAIKDGKYQALDFAGVHIEPVQAYNKNHDVNECVGYLVTVNGKTLYFAGDTSKTEQMSELKEKNIEYAFLPIDGHFNMDIPEAVECAELIGAKHTVPVHMSPGKLFDRERAEQFVTPSALIVEDGEEIEL